MKFCQLWILFSVLTCSHLMGATTPELPSSKKEDPKDEIARLDQLITATEENLQKEKALREILVKYKQIEMLAIKNPDDVDNLLKLVSLAKKARESIVDLALEDYFSPQFLEELKKLS